MAAGHGNMQLDNKEDAHKLSHMDSKSVRDAMQLLHGPSDEHRFVGLMLITKLIDSASSTRSPPATTRSGESVEDLIKLRKEILEAVGPKFFRRLLTSIFKATSVVDDKFSETHISMYQRLALQILSSFSRDADAEICTLFASFGLLDPILSIMSTSVYNFTRREAQLSESSSGTTSPRIEIATRSEAHEMDRLALLDCTEILLALTSSKSSYEAVMRGKTVQVLVSILEDSLPIAANVVGPYKNLQTQQPSSEDNSHTQLLPRLAQVLDQLLLPSDADCLRIRDMLFPSSSSPTLGARLAKVLAKDLSSIKLQLLRTTARLVCEAPHIIFDAVNNSETHNYLREVASDLLRSHLPSVELRRDVFMLYHGLLTSSPTEKRQAVVHKQSLENKSEDVEKSGQSLLVMAVKLSAIEVKLTLDDLATLFIERFESTLTRVHEEFETSQGSPFLRDDIDVKIQLLVLCLGIIEECILILCADEQVPVLDFMSMDELLSLRRDLSGVATVIAEFVQSAKEWTNKQLGNVDPSQPHMEANHQLLVYICVLCSRVLGIWLSEEDEDATTLVEDFDIMNYLIELPAACITTPSSLFACERFEAAEKTKSGDVTYIKAAQFLGPFLWSFHEYGQSSAAYHKVNWEAAWRAIGPPPSDNSEFQS